MTSSDHGRPVPAEIWDRRYRAGEFELLDSIGEIGHYAVVAGYLRLFGTPAILDVGCGHGRLAGLLAGGSFERYLGIDVSAEAIRRAKRHARKRMRFEVADLDTWRPSARFGAIVFCESLQFATHPVSTLVRYAHALTDRGVLIVSIYRHRKLGGLWRRIWKNVDRYFATVDVTTVSNHAGQTWDVRLLRPRAGRTIGPGPRATGSNERGAAPCRRA